MCTPMVARHRTALPVRVWHCGWVNIWYVSTRVWLVPHTHQPSNPHPQIPNNHHQPISTHARTVTCASMELLLPYLSKHMTAKSRARRSCPSGESTSLVVCGYVGVGLWLRVVVIVMRRRGPNDDVGRSASPTKQTTSHQPCTYAPQHQVAHRQARLVHQALELLGGDEELRHARAAADGALSGAVEGLLDQVARALSPVVVVGGGGG